MHRWTFFTLCGLLLGASGCGGDASGPPTNSSPPPPTSSAPPPSTIPVGRDPAANNTGSPPPPKPLAKASRPPKDDGPPEQMFWLTEDQDEFTVDTQPTPSQLFFVNAANPEGSIVTAELPGVTAPDVTQRIPAGFTPVLREGYTDSGWPRRIRGDVDGKEMACLLRGMTVARPMPHPPIRRPWIRTTST